MSINYRYKHIDLLSITTYRSILSITTYISTVDTYISINSRYLHIDLLSIIIHIDQQSIPTYRFMSNTDCKLLCIIHLLINLVLIISVGSTIANVPFFTVIIHKLIVNNCRHYDALIDDICETLSTNSPQLTKFALAYYKWSEPKNVILLLTYFIVFFPTITDKELF